MSGFTSGWLALREPLDAGARSLALDAEVAAWRRDRDTLAVVDLGAGTGANLRHLAPRLGGAQRWTLVDHDPGLLELAQPRTAAWASGLGLKVSRRGQTLRLSGPGADWAVERRCTDLAGPGTLLDGRPALVTAAALLDLVSAAWLRRLVDEAAGLGSALLLALVYDGGADFRPRHPADEEVRRLVNAHQRRDKGFGPALGPRAARFAHALLRRRRFLVREAASDWQVGPDAPALQAAFVEGWASAALEQAPEPRALVEGWRKARLDLISAACSRLRVGHRDFWAVPPGRRPTDSA